MKHFLGGLGPPGSGEPKCFQVEDLVQKARDGVFIPSGNDRSHRGAALLVAGLHRRSAGGQAAEMFGRRGHLTRTFATLHIAGCVPSMIFFVTVKIA